VADLGIDPGQCLFRKIFPDKFLKSNLYFAFSPLAQQSLARSVGRVVLLALPALLGA
jgi:hypothetical protein